MLKIGEFSKLSQLTIKALRFYEKEGLLMPASIDEWTGYRFYETSQLDKAAKIKAYRQLDLSIEEIKLIFSGTDPRQILQFKADALELEKRSIDNRLSIINHILEDKELKYQVTEKIIPACIVYSCETVLKSYNELMSFVPTCGERCLKLNPNMKCVENAYSFNEYLDEEHKETDIKVRYSEAVLEKGNEDDFVKFREIPETKVISILHKGPYENLTEAYAFIFKYAEENGYKCKDFIRESYIDGIWNKEDPADWLTEIQMPVE